MKAARHSRQARGSTAIDGAVALMVILLMVQIWLLSATLDAYLSGHHETSVPGAIVSGLIFAACTILYLFVLRIESGASAPNRDRQGAGDGR